MLHLLPELRYLRLLRLYRLHVLHKGAAPSVFDRAERGGGSLAAREVLGARLGRLGLSARLLSRRAPSEHLALQLSRALLELLRPPLVPLACCLEALELTRARLVGVGVLPDVFAWI